MFSDNGTQFVRFKKQLTEAQIKNSKDELKKMATKKGIEWHFIPARTPHFGGSWERGVRMIKEPLRKISHNKKLHYTECETLLKRIESWVNDRPLTVTQADNYTVITPSMLAVGKRLNQIHLDWEDTGATLTIKRQWTHREHTMKEIWKAWTKQYLQNLQLTNKWFKGTPNVKTGDAVLLVDQMKKKHNWELAVVQNVHLGRDGRVRMIDVKQTHIKHPHTTKITTVNITQVAPMEIRDKL